MQENINNDPVDFNAFSSLSFSFKMTNLALKISNTGPKITAPTIDTIVKERSHTSRSKDVPKYKDEIITVKNDKNAFNKEIKESPRVTLRVVPENLESKFKTKVL